MASFDDDNDPTAGSGSENEDEEMEDVNEEPEQDAQDQDMDNGDDEDEDENNDDDDDDNDDDEEGDDEHQDSPSQRPSQAHRPSSQDPGNPSVVLTSPSPHGSNVHSPGTASRLPYIPSTRSEALEAVAYDIVPTMAAPQSTSINAVAATPDMRWVFSGGTDGYVRMFNWVETANGKVPLTVAQKHPFVDSVMKAGSLVTYWENEEGVTNEGQLRTPPRGGANDEDGKWLSPVYSLAVQHQAIWLLSGLESGGINLQTCRHQAGTRIATLKEHTSAVSVLSLSQDETSVLSGSWDKTIHDWDLNTGEVKRSFRGSGSQISAIEMRPASSIPIPEVLDSPPEPMNGTFSSNNASAPRANGVIPGVFGATGDEEDAPGSPSGSLFGENDPGDHGSLFGDDGDVSGGGAGDPFGMEDDDDGGLGAALSQELSQVDGAAEAAENPENETGLGSGGPVQPPSDENITNSVLDGTDAFATDVKIDLSQQEETKETNGALPHGLPLSDEPLTAPPTASDKETAPMTSADLPPQQESTFLDAAIDGTIRIWDRRMPDPVATILPYAGTPPWCTGACWSPDGNFFYAGRRNCTVDEYSIHHLGSKRSEPERVFKFQNGSGPVYSVRAMPNSRHLVCASNDILRLYDLKASQMGRSTPVPFTIVPGHRGGVISAIYIDPTCRFMLSAAGNRGWEGGGTEVLLGYEIGVQDAAGVWNK